LRGGESGRTHEEDRGDLDTGREAAVPATLEPAAAIRRMIEVLLLRLTNLAKVHAELIPVVGRKQRRALA
jgi:hypothetical protein